MPLPARPVPRVFRRLPLATRMPVRSLRAIAGQTVGFQGPVTWTVSCINPATGVGPTNSGSDFCKVGYLVRVSISSNFSLLTPIASSFGPVTVQLQRLAQGVLSMNLHRPSASGLPRDRQRGQILRALCSGPDGPLLELPGWWSTLVEHGPSPVASKRSPTSRPLLKLGPVEWRQPTQIIQAATNSAMTNGFLATEVQVTSRHRVANMRQADRSRARSVRTTAARRRSIPAGYRWS